MAHVHARDRYSNHFTSKIFEPVQSEQESRFIPHGKRRDQSTSELFGTYQDKELRAMPKTFEPKEDGFNARQKKHSFLSSDVLPRTAYDPAPRGGYNGSDSLEPGCMLHDTDELIYPKMRRQQEHSSELFGRETPAALHSEVHDPERRLAPTNYKWHSHPAQKSSGEQHHSDRHYNEKCSQVFEHASPKAHKSHPHVQEQLRVDKDEFDQTEQKRRHNHQFSDLFGRSTPMDAPGASHRPKHMGAPEDRITIHQDWTDSKTEIVCGQRTGGPDHAPLTRKHTELHGTRLFGGGSGHAPPEMVEPVHHCNLHKVKGAVGMHTQEIHQAHLRSSQHSEDFYDQAHGTKHWEVVELHLAGLDYAHNEDMIRNICNGCDLHIVKVSVEMDPVRNLCKGRAKVMVRYNPKRDSVAGLVSKFEEANFRVEV